MRQQLRLMYDRERHDRSALSKYMLLFKSRHEYAI